MNKPVIMHSDSEKAPYQKPQPWGMPRDMIIPDVLNADENLWVPIGENL